MRVGIVSVLLVAEALGLERNRCSINLYWLKAGMNLFLSVPFALPFSHVSSTHPQLPSYLCLLVGHMLAMLVEHGR